MLKFVKENLVLFLGLTVPVIVMLLFFIANAFDHSASLKPSDLRYPILLSAQTTSNNSTPFNAQVFVENQTLYVQYTHVERGVGSVPELYIYEPATQKLKKLDFPPPAVNDSSVFDKKTPVMATQTMKIDTTLTSPDGFEFKYSNDEYHNDGIINELIVGGSTGEMDGPYLKKGSSYFPLLLRNQLGGRYFQTQFIGWVVSKKE
jgi:hypothetical protein